jgi:hypothetical protein
VGYSSGMSRLQSTGYLNCSIQCLPGAQGTTIETAAECLALYVFGNQIGCLLDLTYFVNCDDVWVIESRGSPRLLFQAL